MHQLGTNQNKDEVKVHLIQNKDDYTSLTGVTVSNREDLVSCTLEIIYSDEILPRGRI